MPGYRPQLDSLRAFAVAPVLAAHFWLFDLQLSALGVRLFFVLSGYLLTSILLRERSEAEQQDVPRRAVLRDFYVRRILRIWPAYYAALIAAVIMGAQSVRETFAWHAFFASNVLFFLEQQWFPEVTAHLWTLAVEEQFYLLLPLLVLFLPQKLLRPVLLSSIIAAIAYRLAVSLFVEHSIYFYLILPIAQLDALGIGSLLAVVQRTSGPIDWRKLLLWSLPPAAFLYFAPLPARVEIAFGHAIYLLPMVALVAGADAGIGGLAGRVLSARPIVALGRISYGVYLYHMFVAAAVDKFADVLALPRVPDGPFRYLFLFGVTIAVAAASWVGLERPMLALRRYFRSATGTETVIPAAPSESLERTVK